MTRIFINTGIDDALARAEACGSTRGRAPSWKPIGTQGADDEPTGAVRGAGPSRPAGRRVGDRGDAPLLAQYGDPRSGHVRMAGRRPLPRLALGVRPPGRPKRDRDPWMWRLRGRVRLERLGRRLRDALLRLAR